jgi:hypothetical protein
MGLRDDFRTMDKDRRRMATERVRFAESRRTPRDKKYAAKIDELIPKAVQAADAALGDMPPRRDPMRRFAWEAAWSREFHAAMDALALARGLRKQSQQAFAELAGALQ